MDPNYKSELYHRVFRGIFDSDRNVSSINVSFGRLSYDIKSSLKGGDAIGPELSIGQVSTQDIRGFQSGGYSVLKRGTPTYTDPFGPATGTMSFVSRAHTFTSTGRMDKPALSRAMAPMFMSEAGTQGIGVFWETELAHRFAYHSGVTPGVNKSAYIPMKQMMSEALPELIGAGTRQHSLVAAIHKSKGAGAAHILSAAQDLGGPLASLGQTQQLEAMFHGVSKHMGFDWFKNFLARNGVQGLSGVNYSLFNINDPHNVTKYFDIINEIPHGIKGPTAGRALHIAGPEKLTPFIRRVRKFYGREYAATLESFANSIFSKVSEPRDIALLMTEDKGLFLGLTGRAEKYVPLPAELHGVMRYGQQMATVRPVLDRATGKVMSVSQIHLREFIEGFGTHGSTNVGSSIEAGHNWAAKAYDYVTGEAGGVQFKGMKQPITELGEVSFYSAMFDKGTIRVDSKSNRRYGMALKDAIDRSGRQTMVDAPGHLLAGARADLEMAAGLGHGIQASLYHAIKADFPGVYPTAELGKLWLPDSFTVRNLTKGGHALRGRQEIVSASRLGRIAKAGAAVGLFGGSRPIGIMPGDIAAIKGLKEIWSKVRGTSTSPILNFPMAIGVVGGRASSGAGLSGILGDSGGLRTKAGSLLTRARRSTISRELELTSHGAAEFLTALDPMGTKLKVLREKILAGGSFTSFEGGIPIGRAAREAAGLPQDARFLSAATFSKTTGKTKFTFLGGAVDSPADALLINDTRVAIRNAPESYLKGMFGTLSEATHVIVSQATFAATNIQTTTFQHRTGLLATQKGIEAGGVEEFLKRYTAAGGEGLEQVGGQITYGEGFEFANFKRASGRALHELGFSPGQTRGFAMPSARAGAGMLRLGGFKGYHLGSLAGGAAAPQDFRIMLGTGADRFKGLSDILNQEHAFSTRLESLNLMAQSTYSQFGMKTPWQHPVWSKLATHYEKSTGVRLSRASFSVNNFVVPGGMPESVNNLLAPLYDKHFERSGQTSFHGIDILTRRQAYEKYAATEGGVNVRMMNRKGMSFHELSMTKLLEAGRKGFFLDIGNDPWMLPDSGVKSPRTRGKAYRSRYIYVDSGANFQKLIGGVVPQRGSYFHSIVGLISSDPRGASEIVQGSGELHSAQAYFAGAWRGIAGMGGKKGALNKTMLRSTRAPNSMRGRLVGQLGLGSMKYDADIYQIGISEDLIREMSGSAGEYNEMLAQAKRGRLYGGVRPSPTHGTGHMPVVTFRLDKSLSTGIKGEATMSIHPFLAWMLNRDLDKDTLEGIAILDIEPGVTQPKTMIAKQLKIERAQFQGWKSSVAKMSGHEKAIGAAGMTLDALSQHALSYFGFGNIPPVAFMGTYSSLAFGGEVARETDFAMMAAKQDRISRSRMTKGFTAAELQGYQKLLGSNPERTFGQAMMLQQNVFQSGITKAGGGLRSLMADLLEITPKAAAMLDAHEPNSKVIYMAQQHAAAWLREMVDMKGGNEVMSKVRVGMNFTGSDEALIEHMAKQLGRVYGMTAIAQAQHYKPLQTPPHVIHEALGTAKGGRLSTLGVLTHGEEIPEALEAGEHMDPGDLNLGKTQAEIAELNNAAREAGDRAAVSASKNKSARSIFRKNWKYIAGAAVALAGLRALTAAGSQMENFQSDQAPLPPRPLQGMDVPEFNPVSLGQPTASVMPLNGYHSASDVRASMSAGNIQAAMLAMQISTSAQFGQFTTLNINDSRRTQSNWELQRMADARDQSDFIHEYQYI